MPRVSVVIPIYTSGHFFVDAVRSVLDQTFQDFEVIVVDNGRTERIKKAVTGFNDSRIRYICQDGIGVSAAQNVGTKVSCGEYITGLSTGDLYLPRNLEMKVKLLDSRPDIGLVFSDAYIFNHYTGATVSKAWRDPNGPCGFVEPARAARQPLKEVLSRGCFFVFQTAMIRRRVFETVGYFDESLPSHEDWEMIIRIVQRFPIEMIDTPLLKCRRQRTNFNETREKVYLGAIAAVKKVMRSGLLSREEIKLLKNKMLPQYLSYGQEALLGGREAAARKAFLAGIQLDPWKIKTYVYLVFSILGTRKLLVLKNWRKKLRRHSLGYQPSGDTKY